MDTADFIQYCFATLGNKLIDFSDIILGEPRLMSGSSGSVRDCRILAGQMPAI